MKNMNNNAKDMGINFRIKSFESTLEYLMERLEASKTITFTPTDGVNSKKGRNYVDLEMPIEELGIRESAVRIMKHTSKVNTLGDALCVYVLEMNSYSSTERCTKDVVNALNQKGFSVNTREFQDYFEKRIENLFVRHLKRNLRALNCLD